MRVLHFVTGGFSGATQVAVDLCRAAQASADPTLLVLRRKRQTSSERIQTLRDSGLAVDVVPGWSVPITVASLCRIARRWQPDVLVAHGFSEHLWGRWAGLLAGVPHLVQVEHNARERYTPWRLAQARWLARRTDAIVGVSEGVRQVLIARGFPAQRCLAIPNGIDLNRFPEKQQLPWAQREPALIMAARFARQKDHATLIRALAMLGQRGLHPVLYLAGGGKAAQEQAARVLVQQTGLTAQVRFLGRIDDLPERMMRTQINILSTHYEGMGLALAEGMAAGCACIGTDVVGVQNVIDHERTGLLVPEGDAQALADAIQRLMSEPDRAAALARRGREKARAEFSLSLMQSRYTTLLRSLCAPGH